MVGIGAGNFHSLARTADGTLYSWGHGGFGQLGSGGEAEVMLPTTLPALTALRVRAAACGEHHTAVLTSAPWSKVRQDVGAWYHTVKVEHEMKMRVLKKTHRGLSQKDLQKIKEEMAKWGLLNDLNKKKSAMEEEEQAPKDVSDALSAGEEDASSDEQWGNEEEGEEHEADDGEEDHAEDDDGRGALPERPTTASSVGWRIVDD